MGTNMDISECCMMNEELLYKIPTHTATLKGHMDQDNKGNIIENGSNSF
jgi:hypothetical protein